MAFSTKLAGRAPALLRQAGRLPAAVSRRPLTTVGAATTASTYSKLLSQSRTAELIQKRSLSASAIRPAVSQEAPNPKAYLESGVIRPKDVVDVKKVLVIGSGGLAIGQAGEFDYSGESLAFPSSPHRPRLSPRPVSS